MPDRFDVQVLSDVHSEFGPEAMIAPDDVFTDADLVLLPGDLARAADSAPVVRSMFPRAAHVVHVTGNHEHYRTGMTVPQAISLMRQRAVEQQVVFLEKEEIILPVGDIAVRILGCTLWTDFALYGRPERDQKLVRMALNDYRLVRGTRRGDSAPGQSHGDLRSGFRPLQPEEVLGFFRESRAFLEEILARQHDGPTIVMTHHLPSLRSVAARFTDDPVSAGFASNLDDLLAMGAALWVHGHTHDSMKYRDASGTLVVCNPAGYASRSGQRENRLFAPRLTVRVAWDASERRWRADVREASSS